MTDSGDTSLAIKRKRSRRVCTECRQQKARCDAQERYPHPCSRCQRQFPILTCRIDPSFSRKRKGEPRDPSQVNHAHVAIPPPPPHPSTVNGATILLQADQQGRNMEDHVRLSEVEPLGTLSRFPSLSLPGSAEVLQLGKARITVEEGAYLFDAFFDHNHPSLQLFIQRPEYLECYKSEPLLFWAIICVSAFERSAPHGAVTDPSSSLNGGLNDPGPSTGLRDASGLPAWSAPPEATSSPSDLYSLLVDEVKQLAAELVIRPPRTHAAVQALLILAEWPLPAPRRRDDLVWTYSHMALHIAYQLGLNKPFHAHDFSSRVTAPADSCLGRERTLAWLQCYRLNVEVAIRTGLPCSVVDDWAIIQASAFDPALPPEWLRGISVETLSILKIMRLGRRILNELGSSPITTSGQVEIDTSLPLIRLFASEMTDLEQQLGHWVHLNVRIGLFKIRMLLYSFALQLDPRKVPRHERIKDLLDCHQTCMQVIELNGPVPEVSLCPASFKFSLYMATICLLKILILPESSMLNKQDILQRLSSIYAQIEACAVRGDHMKTSSHFILYLVTIVEHLDVRADFDSRPFIVSSRLGWANWLYELIGLAKKVRERHRAASQPDMIPVSGPNNESWTRNANQIVQQSTHGQSPYDFLSTVSSVPQDSLGFEWETLVSFLNDGE